MAEYFNQWIKWRSIKLIILLLITGGALYLSLPLWRKQEVASYQAYSREVADYINHDEGIDEVIWFGVGSQPFPMASYYLAANKRWIGLSGFALNYVDVRQHMEQEGENQVMRIDLTWKNPAGHYFLFEQWRDINLPTPVCTKKVFGNDLYALFYCSAEDIEILISHTSQGRLRFTRSVR